MRLFATRFLFCFALGICLGSDAFAVSSGARTQAARYDYAGYRLSEWKRDREAIVYYTAAIKANPDDFPAHFNRAGCYIGEKEWDKALADCNTAVRLKPAYADTYYLRALVLYSLSRDSEARADVERCERGKLGATARQGAAYLRVKLCENSANPAPNELRTNIQTLDRSVADARTAEDKAVALNNRAWFFAVCRANPGPHLAQALDDATEAVRLQRTYHHLDTLATVHARRGDYMKAIEVEEKTLAMAWHDSRSKGIYKRHLAAFESHQPYFLTTEDRR